MPGSPARIAPGSTTRASRRFTGSAPNLLYFASDAWQFPTQVSESLSRPATRNVWCGAVCRDTPSAGGSRARSTSRAPGRGVRTPPRSRDSLLCPYAAAGPTRPKAEGDRFRRDFRRIPADAAKGRGQPDLLHPRPRTSGIQRIVILRSRRRSSIRAPLLLNTRRKRSCIDSLSEEGSFGWGCSLLEPTFVPSLVAQ